MTIPNFIQWLEDSYERQIDSPASAEVIRTGIQPQVDAEDMTQGRESHDEIMALDSHIQRIKEISRRMTSKSETSVRLQELLDEFADSWDSILSGSSNQEEKSGDGLGDAMPSEDELNYYKDNQPRPESPRNSIPGGQPPIS